MQMVFDEIIYNVEIDDSIFDMPEVTAPVDSVDVEIEKDVESGENPE